MTERTQPQGAFVSGSQLNVLDFLIRSIVKGMINTAIPVRVDAIERPGDGSGAGYLSATPLVKMRSASGEALEPVSIPKLRWFRLQHGTAALSRTSRRSREGPRRNSRGASDATT